MLHSATSAALRRTRTLYAVNSVGVRCAGPASSIGNGRGSRDNSAIELGVAARSAARRRTVPESVAIDRSRICGATVCAASTSRGFSAWTGAGSDEADEDSALSADSATRYYLI